VWLGRMSLKVEDLVAECWEGPKERGAGFCGEGLWRLGVGLGGFLCLLTFVKQYSDALWWETYQLYFAFPVSFTGERKTWSRDRYLGLRTRRKACVVVSLCLSSVA